jgi:hypothetical protein
MQKMLDENKLQLTNENNLKARQDASKAASARSMDGGE